MSKMLLKNIENGGISLEKSEQETLSEMAENGLDSSARRSLGRARGARRVVLSAHNAGERATAEGGTGRL